MNKLDAILGAQREAEPFDMERTLADIAAEEAPTAEEVETMCGSCASLRLPCLYRQTWAADDGLWRICPKLRGWFEGEEV